MEPLITHARDWHAGTTCPLCGIALRMHEEIAQCRRCGAVHHLHCWQDRAGCAAYDCAPPNRTADGYAPPLVITTESLAAAVPLPPPLSNILFTPPRAGAAQRPRLSRAALAGFICAIAGIPLFGILTGAVAIVLSAISLGGIRAGARRGVWLACIGIIVGLGDMVGWAIVLARHFDDMPAAQVDLADFRVSAEDLKLAQPPVAAALRANVLITTHGVLQSGLGSGVILEIRDGKALILTNKHVVGAGSADVSVGHTVTVQYVDGIAQTGEIAWVAPGDTDAAIVRAPVSPAAAPAPMDPRAAPRIGDQVFAIGNPRGLGWTHTAGAVSQFRERPGGTHTLRIIQTTAAVNSGNSGGGLYDAAGHLLGINTWTGDKRVSEGLGFAISLDSLVPLFPDWMKHPASEQTSP